MFDKIVLENGKMLMFVLDCYKNQKICDNAVSNNSHALGSLPNSCKTQRRYDKGLSIYLFQYFMLYLYATCS